MPDDNVSHTIPCSCILTLNLWLPVWHKNEKHKVTAQKEYLGLVLVFCREECCSHTELLPAVQGPISSWLTGGKESKWRGAENPKKLFTDITGRFSAQVWTNLWKNYKISNYLFWSHAKILPKKKEKKAYVTKHRYIRNKILHLYLNTQLCVYIFYILHMYKNTVMSILIKASTNWFKLISEHSGEPAE